MKNQTMETLVLALGKRKRRPKLSNPAIRKLLAEFLKAIVEATITYRHKVAIPGFGIFYVSQRKAKRLRNPITMEWMEIEPSYRLGFRASKAMKFPGRVR